MVVYYKLLINGSEYSDYKRLRLNKSIGQNNYASNVEILFDSPYGRHKNDFSVGGSVLFYADSSPLSNWLTPPSYSGSPVFQYRFNSSGTTIVDTIGSYIGSEVGANGTNYIQGKIGSGLQVTGLTYYSANINGTDVNIGSTFTLSCWLNISGNSTTVVEYGLFSRGRWNALRYGFNFVNGNGSVTPRFSLRSGNDILNYNLGAVSKNNWHHILGIYNGSSYILGYLNGSLVGSTAYVGSGFSANPGSVFIGTNAYVSTTGSKLYIGVDDCRYYNRVLDDSEISYIYHGGEGTEKINNIDDVSTQKLYNGIIEKVKFSGEETRQECELSGRDYTARLMDLTIKPIVFTNTEVSTIVKNILSNNNVPDITTNNVQTTTKTLKRIGFNHLPIFDALNQLADLVGYVWYIDSSKDLHFEPDNSVSSGYTLNNENIIRCEYDKSRQEMANQIWVYGDRYLSEAPTEIFNLGSPVGYSGCTLVHKPHNTKVSYLGSVLKGSVEGMSINPVSGVDYGVSFDDRAVIFYSGTNFPNFPTSGGSVVIQYDRDLPIIKYGQNDLSISLYGPKELVVNDQTIKDPQTAMDILKQKLEESDPINRLKVKTRGWLTLNQSNTINLVLDDFNFNEEVGINNIEYNFDKSTINNERIINLTLNRKFPEITDKLKEIINKQRLSEAQNMQDSDVYTRLFTNKDTFSVTGSSSLIKTRTVGSSFILANPTLSLLGSYSNHSLGFWGGTFQTVFSGT
jgi:hypothetical protein